MGQENIHLVVLALPKEFRKTFISLFLNMKENQVVLTVTISLFTVPADVVINRFAFNHCMARYARIVRLRAFESITLVCDSN